MTRRWGWLGLLALLVLGAATWTLRPSPCSRPIAYRLGQIDERFGLRSEEVLDALRQAGSVWAVGTGRTLFVYDPGASPQVTLAYDVPDQATEDRRRPKGRM